MQLALFTNKGSVARFDLAAGTTLPGTQTIHHTWKGLPPLWSRIDAAVNVGNGKIALFNGKKQVLYGIATATCGSEHLMHTGWPGMPYHWTGLDAALNLGDGKLLFFRDFEAARFDLPFNKFVTQAQPIKDLVPGYPWPRVDAALNRGDGRAFLFREGYHAVFDPFTQKITGVHSIAQHWPGLPWSAVEAAVNLDAKSETMGRRIEELASSKMVGYAYAIYEGKRLTKTGAGGTRSTAGTPPENWRYSANTEVEVGSVSKFLTAIGFIKLLAEQKPAVIIDSSIAPWLPSDWTKGPNIETVTFRQLLTHTSGFRLNKDDWEGLKAMIAAGIKMEDKSEVYRNTNFTLLRVIMPQMRKWMYVAPQPPDFQAASRYKTLMKELVFTPAFVANADCKVNSPDEAWWHGMASNPLTPRRDTDDWSLLAGAACWKLSTLELGRVLNFFFATERILNSGLRDWMIEKKFGCFSFPDLAITAWHNGSLILNGRGTYSCFHLFDDGVHCVLLSNSLPDNPNADAIVRQAHAEAFPKP